MEEYEDDTERTEVTHGKKKDGEDTLPVCAPISKLVVCYLLWNVPAYKETRQHAP